MLMSTHTGMVILLLHIVA